MKKRSLAILLLVFFVGSAESFAEHGVAISPTSLDFGSQIVSTISSPLTITYANVGSSSEVIESIAVSGNFSETTNCPIETAPVRSGSSCTISVTFTPTATGPAFGTLIITAENNLRQVVTLAGSGIVLTKLIVSPAIVAIPVGRTRQMTATGVFSDDSTQDLTTVVTWSSSNPDVLVISNAVGSQGLVTSISVGGASINATANGLGSTSSISDTVINSVIPDTPRFAYVPHFFDQTVSIYTLDYTSGSPTFGELRANGYVLAGNEPREVIVDPASRFAYVPNASDNTISAFSINAVNGDLTPVPGSPFPSGALPLIGVVDPQGNYLYIANGSSNDISAFSIDSKSGALTPVPGSPFAAGAGPNSVTVDATGRFVYVADEFENTVSGFAIDRNSGALTPIAGSPFPAGASPFSVTVEPTGRFVYVTNKDSNTVSAYSVNPTTGALNPLSGSPYGTGITPLFPTVDPGGRFLYVDNLSDQTISAFAIDATGRLSPVPGSPFKTAAELPGVVTIDPTGKFAYVCSSNQVEEYSINADTGALSPLGVIRTRVGPASITLGNGTTSITYVPTFAFVIASPDLFAQDQNGTVSGFRVNSVSGDLTPIGVLPFQRNPSGIAVDRTSRFVYVPSKESGNISGYSIDPNSGVLTPVPGSPFFGEQAERVAIEPSGRFVYVSSGNGFSNYVKAYKIDPSNGALSAIAGSPFVINNLDFEHRPNEMTVDPTGRFLYVVEEQSDPSVEFSGIFGGLVVFAIDAVTGELVLVQTLFSREIDHAVLLTVDRTGSFLYLLDGGAPVTGIKPTLHAYAIDAATGALSGIDSQIGQTVPFDLAGDAAAPYLFIAPLPVDPNDPFHIGAWTIDENSGSLSLVPGTPVPAGLGGIVVDPSGRFIYQVDDFLRSITGFVLAAGVPSVAIEPVLMTMQPKNMAFAWRIQ